MIKKSILCALSGQNNTSTHKRFIIHVVSPLYTAPGFCPALLIYGG